MSTCWPFRKLSGALLHMQRSVHRHTVVVRPLMCPCCNNSKPLHVKNKERAAHELEHGKPALKKPPFNDGWQGTREKMSQVMRDMETRPLPKTTFNDHSSVTPQVAAATFLQTCCLSKRCRPRRPCVPHFVAKAWLDNRIGRSSKRRPPSEPPQKKS